MFTEDKIETEILMEKTEHQRRHMLAAAWLIFKTCGAIALFMLMINGVLHHMALPNSGGAAFYGILAVGFFCVLMKYLWELAKH